MCFSAYERKLPTNRSKSQLLANAYAEVRIRWRQASQYTLNYEKQEADRHWRQMKYTEQANKRGI